MSLSSRERRNPPPRRKSCAACIKAKRRCDFALPACLRCEQRHIVCEYPSGVTGATPRRRPQAAAAAAAAAARPLVSSPPHPVSQHAGGVPALCDGSGGVFDDTQIADTACFDTFSMPEPDASVCLDTPVLDFARFNFAMEGDDAAAALGVVHQPPRALTPPLSEKLEFLSQVVAKRLQFSIDEIRKAPTTMVLETQTAWSHPRLYEDGMPKSMRDAYAACALYLAKNHVNAPVIFRSIEANVSELLAASIPVTAMESVAHTQALILYQIIRLLDGDISARASAERHIGALEKSALNLLAHVQFHYEIEATKSTTTSATTTTTSSSSSSSSSSSISPSASTHLPLYPIAKTKAFWADWVFQESARRTLMLTFFLLQTYRILTGHTNLQCDGRLGLCHSWTLSAQLWRAQSPAAFADAWRANKFFIVKDASFQTVIEEAVAEDVDDFGKIWITAALGIEEAEGWFAARGGALRTPAMAC